MPPNLNRMLVFATVVERSSFTEAAQRLGLTKGAISKQIRALEEELGVRLLNRTTRRLSMTEAGQAYYQSCSRIMAEAEAIQRRLSKLQDQPLGTLRISGPVFLGQTWLTPAVLAFMKQYPDLSVELWLQDELVDLVDNEIDVAIRVAPLEDSSLVIRRLAKFERIVTASPQYLRKAGTPKKPSDLADHAWLSFAYTVGGEKRLRFTARDGRRHAVSVSGRLHTNNAHAIRQALLSGAGVSMPPSFVVQDAIDDGRLRALLKGYRLPTMWLCAVYPHSHDLAAKQRLLVDFLQHQYPPPTP